MRVASEEFARASVEGAQWEKSLYLSYLSAEEKSIQRSFLMPIITSKIVPDRIVYSDGRRGYNVLDVRDFKHYMISHSEAFVDAKNHINGIENFWN
jgi:transposase-like protein